MTTQTKSWLENTERFNDFPPSPAIEALQQISERITNSDLSKGIFGWTSMTTLCIVQQQVTYPYNGPELRISPIGDSELEFYYMDTLVSDRQWHRVVPAHAGWSRLLAFLKQLNWFTNLELQAIPHPIKPKDSPDKI